MTRDKAERLEVRRELYDARRVFWMTAKERDAYDVAPDAAKIARRPAVAMRRPALSGVRIG